MTPATVMLLDYGVAAAGFAGWVGAGVTGALGRRRASLALLVAAAVATLARVGTVALLGAFGWWFVEEKVLLVLPLTLASDLAAVIHARSVIGVTEGPSPSAVVAYFTAGSAAFAGLVVSFLIGPRLTLLTGLVTVGAVALAAVVRARAVPARESHKDGNGLTRRSVLAAVGGAATVGVAGALVGSSFGSAREVTTRRGLAHGAHVGRARSRQTVSIADLRGAATPSVTGRVREHVLTAVRANVRLPSGRTVEAWTFDGSLPGPALVVDEGDVLRVTLRNRDIDQGVTLHWHGYDVACGEDGVPDLTQRVVAPGEEFGYQFRTDQVGTYWFHTHSVSHIGVRKGLYGTLVVRPRATTLRRRAAELDLTVPIHSLEGVLLLGGSDVRTYRDAETGTRVRLRVVNTDSSAHRIALVGTSFRVAAVDGRDLNEPGEVTGRALTVPAGGRRDLVLDMPAAVVSLVVDDRDTGGLRLAPPCRRVPDMKADTSGWAELDLLHYGGVCPPPFDASRPDRSFELVLDRGLALSDGAPVLAYKVNGAAYTIPAQVVQYGDVVRFTVVNRSLEVHPWHLHGHPVLVLLRNGTRPTGSPLLVDTFDVLPGEVWEVAFRATNRGIWMNHCHNLPHADQGMMLHLAYDGVESPFAGGHAGHE
ncbi:multicopper oxidase family protein [Intrasporangium sp. DVR]|uniref:multicopper oxidase family protein n=1 Tax=Intrasporangium sp. DVR TaxID=3127867 RepID=UPI00313A69B2